MPMDRETRALLKALVEGQVNLAQGQVKLVEGQAKLAQAQARTEGELRQLGKRMDKYTAAVMRGLTNGARRDHGLEKRVDSVEARLSALERQRR